MSILDLFRGGPAPQDNAPAPTGNTPQSGDMQQSQQPNPADAQQAGTGEGAESAGNVSPLDEFNKLWENDPDAKKAPEGDFDPSKLFDINQEDIQKAVGQMNFSQVLPGDIAERIGQGGEGAQEAFAESLNAVARQVFSSSMVGSAKLIEQAMGKASQSLDSRIQNQLRRTTVSNSVRESNPAFNHPAAKPMVKALEEQLTSKYPDATPDEITNMARDYFDKFAQTMSGNKSSGSQESAGEGGTDWEAFLNGDN